MDSAELLQVLSAEGLRLLDSLPPYDSSADIVRMVSGLRSSGHPPALIAAVLSQSKLRAKAQSKFGPFAERMLFTQEGLEQATRLKVAALHAGRFQRAGVKWVADLGCGIGADALALAALDLEVTAVEHDEVTAALAAYNLAPWSNVRVEHADATIFDLAGVDGVYLDPARRGGGRRLPDPRDWSPSLDFAFDLARRYPTGIKLGPGIDRALLPEGCEAQWISVDGEVVEVGLWFGAVARPGVGRSALVVSGAGAVEMSASTDTEDVDTGSIGQFVLEPDGAVIRARLIGDLARTVGARMLSPGIAYLTSDEDVTTPFARSFRVLERMPLDERVLRKALAQRGIGSLEIKKRGVDIEPSRLRDRLALKGPEAGTLLLTRVEGRHAALLVERTDR